MANFESPALSLDMLDGNAPQALVPNMGEPIRQVMQLPGISTVQYSTVQAFPNTPTGIAQVPAWRCGLWYGRYSAWRDSRLYQGELIPDEEVGFTS